ncbi:hypothetical protein ACSQ67_016654 [Phaseolus vulgaris]
MLSFLLYTLLCVKGLRILYHPFSLFVLPTAIDAFSPFRWKIKADDPPLALPYVEFTGGLLLDLEPIS